MQDNLQQLLQKENAHVHLNQGISVVNVADSAAGFSLAKQILYGMVDTRTLLLLSGGRTPKELYHELAREERLQPGAVGMVDERYGAKWHATSNEKMLQESGLLRYLQMVDIPFYPILAEKESRAEAAEDYDIILRELQTVYHKTIAILGIGLDGHTAGIAGNRNDFQNPVFEASQKHAVVSEFDDSEGMFKERVTMTFLGLSMLDLLVVLVFGDDKKAALDLTFAAGSDEEVPAQFFKRPEIAKKTLLITDQQV